MAAVSFIIWAINLTGRLPVCLHLPLATLLFLSPSLTIPLFLPLLLSVYSSFVSLFLYSSLLSSFPSFSFSFPLLPLLHLSLPQPNDLTRSAPSFPPFTHLAPSSPAPKMTSPGSTIIPSRRRTRPVPPARLTPAAGNKWASGLQ